MQKGTVCGADRSVYKLNFFPLDFCCILFFNFSLFCICKGLGWNICLKCLQFLSNHIRLNSNLSFAIVVSVLA